MIRLINLLAAARLAAARVAMPVAAFGLGRGDVVDRVGAA